eukprot:COSAG02_NODE_101_length_36804_cov_125.342951_23_plen_80_part_00
MTVRALVQVTLEDLPRVLAVQVKRFVYLDGQPKKLHRKVSFRQKLALPSKGAHSAGSLIVQMCDAVPQPDVILASQPAY